MTEETWKALAQIWRQDEAKLERLRLLPVGEVDPTEPERLLDAEQDQIEAELGTDYLQGSRMEREGE